VGDLFSAWRPADDEIVESCAGAGGARVPTFTGCLSLLRAFTPEIACGHMRKHSQGCKNAVELFDLFDMVALTQSPRTPSLLLAQGNVISYLCYRVVS
jgi:hypothetical protein